MNADITAMVVIPSILGGFLLIIQAILNHRVKMRLISAGHVDENSVKLLNNSAASLKFDTLKWGLILLFGGIGLILLQYIPYQSDSTLPFGIEAVCVAIGFLVYYGLTRNQIKKELYSQE
ncbi:DUF6249 domain-containing protein [Mucilaginibacter sp.]